MATPVWLRNRLCQFGFLVLVGLWRIDSAAMSPPQPLDCGDNYCDRANGENCDNCEEDCACICGDDVCSSAWPDLETCQQCPEDCYEMCICGDSVCDAPAEGGGPLDEPCDEEDLREGKCSYCPLDCGSCQFFDCDPHVCDAQTGQCRECGTDFECPHLTWCDAGECKEGNLCFSTSDCNEGWFCNGNGVCRPVV